MAFDLHFNDDIAHIVLNRPEKRNAFSADFWAELPATVREIDNEAKARVIVISSTGPIFSAGIDVALLADGVAGGADKNNPRYGAEFLGKVQYLQETFNSLETCRIPVLAAVQGGCLGAGVDMISACDMRYASKDAYFTITEIDVGMTADVGTFPRLLNHLPEGVVRELAYTGRKMSAEEAQSYGLVNQVFPDQEALLAGVMSIAKTIAQKPPLAIFGCKRAITYGRDHTTKDALENIAIWNMSMLNPPEIMEAMSARIQKRVGQFTDLPKIKPNKL